MRLSYHVYKYVFFQVRGNTLYTPHCLLWWVEWSVKSEEWYSLVDSPTLGWKQFLQKTQSSEQWRVGERMELFMKRNISYFMNVG